MSNKNNVRKAVAQIDRIAEELEEKGHTHLAALLDEASQELASSPGKSTRRTASTERLSSAEIREMRDVAKALKQAGRIAEARKLIRLAEEAEALPQHENDDEDTGSEDAAADSEDAAEDSESAAPDSEEADEDEADDDTDDTDDTDDSENEESENEESEAPAPTTAATRRRAAARNNKNARALRRLEVLAAELGDAEEADDDSEPVADSEEDSGSEASSEEDSDMEAEADNVKKAKMRKIVASLQAKGERGLARKLKALLG
jgi:hypothetical protein